MRVRRWATGGLGVVGAVLVAAATAWACVSGPAVSLATINVKPGQEAQLTGTNFTKPDPVTVRWNALDGPVVGTFETAAASGNASGRAFQGNITVPADARAGNYVLVVTQSSADGTLSQMPVRALITVTPDGAATPMVGQSLSPPVAERPAGLVSSEDSVSGGTLALFGLGVAGVGMFVAGVAALFAGRRGRAPEAVRARS